MRRPRSDAMPVAISAGPGPLSSNVEALPRPLGAFRRAPRRRLPAPRPQAGGGVAAPRLLVDPRVRRAVRRAGAPIPGDGRPLERARHGAGSDGTVPGKPRRLDAARRRLARSEE